MRRSDEQHGKVWDDSCGELNLSFYGDLALGLGPEPDDLRAEAAGEGDNSFKQVPSDGQVFQSASPPDESFAPATLYKNCLFTNLSTAFLSGTINVRS